jgi:nitroreductase
VIVLRRCPEIAVMGEEPSMITRGAAGIGAAASFAVAAVYSSAAAHGETIELPAPRPTGGKPLREALALRRSIHAYTAKPLPLQLLSDLLWAANGINRPTEGGRTAPYWRHIMVLDTYAAMADGVWLYDPQAHRLLRHLRDDIRADTGFQDFVGGAPLNLIYVAHGERMPDVSPRERRLFASVDSGFVGQNVYLFCASEGLATVFRGAVSYESLEKTLRLPPEQFVTFAQTVGYPAA